MPRPRSLTPPWSIEELTDCFVVKDASGEALTHIYFEEEPQRRTGTGHLSRDEARRAAVDIATLPDLLMRSE